MTQLIDDNPTVLIDEKSLDLSLRFIHDTPTTISSSCLSCGFPSNNCHYTGCPQLTKKEKR